MNNTGMHTYRTALWGTVAAYIVYAVFSVSVAFAASKPAPSAQALEVKIKQEEKNAAQRKESLQKLTLEERQLNADLAAAETRIIDLEKGIETHQNKLEELVTRDEAERETYEKLLKELEKTEQVQTETLRLLWEIACKRTSVGSRDMADWAIIDREFVWSHALFSSLQAYRILLDTQEAELATVLGRRDKISEEVKNRLTAVNDEKALLLQARVSYENRLAEVRKQKQTTEDELASTIKLIENLQFTLDEKHGPLLRKKGQLPWPVAGKVTKRFAPYASPPFRGLGIACAEGQPVNAIGGGTIVHNGILRGFGTVIVIQHGEEYFSLYAYLGQSNVQVGNNVSQGQKIGTTGFYPLLQGDGMYFELRFKQKAINPEQWLLPLK